MVDQATKQSGASSSLNITEDDLQKTLKDFLETDDKKEDSSIWNIRTICGLGFVFIALAFVGQSIGSELLGSAGVPLLNTIMKLTPYFAGALVGVICLGFLKQSSKKEKSTEKETRHRNQKTYDKLDEFLYTDAKSSSKARSNQKSTGKSSLNSRLQSTGGLGKSRTDKKLFGVCGGLAKYLGVNSTFVRVGFLLAFFLSSGSFFLLYIAMAVVMPKEPIERMDDFN